MEKVVLVVYSEGIGCGGTSYVSGYNVCDANPNLVFTEADMILNNNSDTGLLEVNVLYICPKMCEECTGINKCTKCYKDYYIKDGECELCPENSYGDGVVCIFKPTSNFSDSNDFTYSKEFTNSFKFSNSKSFTQSNDFSDSAEFSHSEEFSNTKNFTISDVFSISKEFSRSGMFSNIQDFTKSADFIYTRD